jgi:membrane-associated phospholipid phosphatase
MSTAQPTLEDDVREPITEAATPAAEAEQRTLPLRGVLLFGLAGVAMMTFIAIAERVVQGHADAFDQRVTLWVYDTLHGDVMHAILLGFTLIGATFGLWGSVALVSCLVIQQGRWPVALLLGVHTGLAQLFNHLMKISFVRDRPDLFDIYTRPPSYSFPSGHAMSAMAVYGAFAIVLTAIYPRQRHVWTVGAALFILAIGFSRVYLGVHWTTDVIAGYAAAIPMLVVFEHLVRILMRRRLGH